MEEENKENLVKVDHTEEIIKNNFKTWILTCAPSYELIAKKWYDNFILSSLNQKIIYLKLVSKFIQIKRKNLNVTRAIFFIKLKMAFAHVSQLPYNSKLLNTISQVTLEWTDNKIFTKAQVKELQDLMISRNSNDSTEEYYGRLSLRIFTQKRSLGLSQSVSAINVEEITITKDNYKILRNHVIILKSLLNDLLKNYTEEKYWAIKTFFQATLLNIDDINRDSNLSLGVNRNILALRYKIIKDSESEKNTF